MKFKLFMEFKYEFYFVFNQNINHSKKPIHNKTSSNTKQWLNKSSSYIFFNFMASSHKFSDRIFLTVSGYYASFPVQRRNRPRQPFTRVHYEKCALEGVQYTTHQLAGAQEVGSARIWSQANKLLSASLLHIALPIIWWAIYKIVALAILVYCV